MATYASPRLTKGVLQTIVTLIFVVGSIMLITASIDTINHFSRLRLLEVNVTMIDDKDYDGMGLREEDTSIDVTREGEDVNVHTHTVPIHGQMAMFPSISSLSVRFMFAGITTGHAMLGIVAITRERVSLLTSYSFVLFVSSFIKLLFLIASAYMHTTMASGKFMTSTSLLGMMTAMVELILIMCTCQLTRLVKRGDAARQEIQSVHSYHLDKRARSRSHSRARSLHNLPCSVSQICIARGASQPYSYHDVQQDSDYCPPPIYLRLDR